MATKMSRHVVHTVVVLASNKALVHTVLLVKAATALSQAV